jgi:hypothetical protein
MAAFWLAQEAPGAALAQTLTVSIPAERDSTLMEAHPQDNDGAWGYLWPKLGNQENRIVVGFRLDALAGRSDDVVTAKVVLRAAKHTFRKFGTRFGIYALEPGALLDWLEGDGRHDHFSYCSRRDLRRAPLRSAGPGVTWTCEVDTGTLDELPLCATPWGELAIWSGGFALPGEPAERLPRGHVATATDSHAEFKGYDPLCRTALACFASSASLDCFRRVEFDVTADVARFLASGEHRPSWVIKKDGPESGAAHFFSREGARCIMREPALGPQLVLTLVERPDDPPQIPEPDDHCAASG